MAKRAIFPLPLLLAGLLLVQTALIGCHGNKAETDTTHTETASTNTDKSFSSDYARKLRGAQNGLDKYVKRITGIAQS